MAIKDDPQNHNHASVNHPQTDESTESTSATNNHVHANTNTNPNIAEPSNLAREEKPIQRSALQIIMSVISALFGIQSDKNRKADFEKGKPSDYIIYGIIGVIALLITMAVIVNRVISSVSHP